MDEKHSSTNSVCRSVVDAVCPNRKGFLCKFNAPLCAVVVLVGSCRLDASKRTPSASCAWFSDPFAWKRQARQPGR